MAETSVDLVFPFNALRSVSNIYRATLRRREFSHEMLIVRTWGYTTQQLNVRTGDPVAAHLKGRGDIPVEFVGHVHHISEDNHPMEQERATEHTIVCVGPTFKMKNGRQKIWKNMLPSDIARQILREHRLTADVENSPMRLTFHQAGESDWSFLCRLANQIGWVVYPVGPVVHFHSRDRDTIHNIRSATKLVRSGADSGWDRPPEIREFCPRLGDIEQPGTAKGQRIVRGVDPRTAQIVSNQHTGKPTLPTRTSAQPGALTIYEKGVVANSGYLAQARSHGSALRGKWSYTATATSVGIGRTKPTDTLYLEGLRGGYDGYWTVIGVDLIYESKAYFFMETELGTDSLGSSKVGKPSGLAAVSGTPKRTSTPVLVYPGGPVAQAASLQGRGGPAAFSWAGSIDTVDPV